jgi:hypothetical protein
MGESTKHLYEDSQSRPVLKRHRREAINWTQMAHPHILLLYGVIYHPFHHDQPVELVSPYVPEGTLEDCYMESKCKDTTYYLTGETRRRLVCPSSCALDSVSIR